MAAPSAGKLLSIAAYYRNDHHDGFAMRFSATTNPSVEVVAAALGRALPRLRTDANEPLIQGALAELKHYAKLSKIKELDPEEAYTAVLAIAWLVETGVIKDGEYDGIVYAYDVGTVH